MVATLAAVALPLEVTGVHRDDDRPRGDDAVDADLDGPRTGGPY